VPCQTLSGKIHGVILNILHACLHRICVRRSLSARMVLVERRFIEPRKRILHVLYHGGMRVLLINPPFQPITTRYGVGSQTPLGLLLVGGAILSRGHEARLLDAEARKLGIEDLVKETAAWQPSVIMTGHAGSTAAHPAIMRMAGFFRPITPRKS
jgi:hypothetical protein